MAQAITNENYAFNAVIILRISIGPSVEVLKRLLQVMQRRHSLLGVHIEEEKDRYYFESSGTPAIPLKVIERQNSRHWQQVVEEELNSGFDMFTGPLIRFTYLIDPGSQSESEIIITCQHSIMDAVSTANLLNEILTFCREESESSGSSEELNILEPVPSAEAFFPPAFKGIRRRVNTFLFIFRQMADEFGYRLRTGGQRKAPIHTEGNNKILPMKLSKELSSALLRCARKNRITINNLLTAAQLMAVHKHLYGSTGLPLRHINTADLRPYLNPPLDPQYFGSYFAMMLFTVKMKENNSIWELARSIGDIVYSSLKRGDKFCTNLLSYSMMRMIFKFKSFRMSSTAMSFTGPLLLDKKYGEIEVLDIHAFVSNFVLGAEYSAVVRLFDDHIYWDIMYLDSDMTHEQAVVIADEIRAILETAVKEEL